MNTWQAKQLEISKSLVQQGSQALRQNDFPTANAALSEANVILDMAEEETLEIMQLRAQVLNEAGFVLQRANEPARALENHQRAAELCEEIMNRGVEFRGNASATNINLAGLLASTGDFDGARAANGRALKLAESMIQDGRDVAQGQNLAFGASSNFAVIAARSGDFEEADTAMRRAVELVGRMNANDAMPGANARAAQACQQLSVLYFNEKRYDDALEWGKTAERLSEKAHKEVGEAALPIYVTSEINLISYHEKSGDFAGAEDALFKALDVVGNHPQILLRGRSLYEELRKQADSKLEAGGLPRDEVNDGFDEINSRIDEIGGLETVLQQVREAEAAMAGGGGGDDDDA